MIVARSDEIGVHGFDLFVPAASRPRDRGDLPAAGAMDVDVETAEVDADRSRPPVFGVDMDEDTIPLEAGIEDRAISLTKGCYVGQEIIIRVLHRGHGRVGEAPGRAGVRAGMRPFRPAGDAVRSGERQIGVVTSATHSPRSAGPSRSATCIAISRSPSTPWSSFAGTEQPARCHVACRSSTGRTDGPEGPSLQILSSQP